MATLLEEFGGGVISSDKLGHTEINSADAKRVLVDWWGQGILTESGDVDRQKVGSIVFADPAQRHRLEALLHPRINIRRKDLMADMESRRQVRFIVMDSPLLYESDLDLECDAVIFVDAPFELRRERSEKTRGWPPGELERREKSQYPLDMKQARADYIIVNNSDMNDLRIQVQRVVDRILSAFDAV